MSAYTIRLDGGESTGPEGIYLVWGEECGYRDVRRCETLAEALSEYGAWGSSDYGYPDCIEGPVGIVPHADVIAWGQARNRRIDALRNAHYASLAGQVRYAVEIREPHGNRAVEYNDFEDLSDAIAAIGELARPGRCRIVQKIFTEARGWGTERVVIDWAPTSIEEQAHQYFQRPSREEVLEWLRVKRIHDLDDVVAELDISLDDEQAA